MSDDVDQGAKVDAHAGAVRSGEVGHGSGQLRVEIPFGTPVLCQRHWRVNCRCDQQPCPCPCHQAQK